MRRRTLYALIGLALGGMALGIVLGVSGIDPASHWVFSVSLLAFFALGVVWAMSLWEAPENRRLLLLMAFAAAGVVVGWIVGETGATTIGGVVFVGSALALIALLVAFVVKRRRTEP